MEIIDGHYVGSGEKNVYTKIAGIGDPPVVIETGLGSLSVEWNDLQAELSNHTTVISYDRAGYGESPKGPEPRVSGQICDELYNMLMNSGIPGPYILVGNSIGGIYIQHFAKMFPAEVAGLIFVDSFSTRANEFDKLEAPNYQEKISMPARIQNIKNILDMEKDEFQASVVPMLNNIYAGFPDELKEAMVLYQSEQSFYKTLVNEYEALAESCRHVDSLQVFTNIPVKVLTRDFEVMIELSKQLGIPEEEARAVEELWLEHSKSLLSLSTDSELMIVKGSNHSIHFSRPDVLISEIIKMVKLIKSE